MFEKSSRPISAKKMPAETEYTRTYRPFVTSPHSPDPPVPAGISSAKLGVTQEPPVGMKRKSKHTESKVAFVTGTGTQNEEGANEHKSFRFKAGFPRPITLARTEYQREFNWPESTTVETSLLNGQHIHHGSKHPTVTYTNPSSKHVYEHCQHHNQIKSKHNQDGLLSAQNQESDQIEAPEDPQDSIELAPKKHSPEKAHKHSSRNQRQRQLIQGLMSKQSRKSEPKIQSAKNHKRKVKHFVTEYQRQFGKSNVRKAKKTKESSAHPSVAGMPRILTDPSDPRLLKHSPLPINAPLTTMVSDYQANYTSPAEVPYQPAAGSPSPQPDWRSTIEQKLSPPVAPVEEQTEVPIPTSYSWYDQLVELRKRAEQYKRRSEGVSIRRLLPLTRQDLLQSNPVSSTISEVTSSTTSSPTPSESVSCQYSDYPHQEKPTPMPMSSQPALMAESEPQSVKVYDIEEESPSIESLQDTLVPIHTEEPVVAPKLFEVPINDRESGRVQTPVIQKSLSDFRRHHLDRTTPVAGGLFISPKKPPDLVLPYPPSSPKFRRDMKSTAPISPAPKRDECVQVDIKACQSSKATSPVVPSPVSKPTQTVPVPSSPHSIRYPAPAHTSKSTSVRKLDFKTSQSRPTSSKRMGNLYSHRVAGLASTGKDNCNICGAHLRPSPVANAGSSSVHTQKFTSGVTSNLANGGLSTSKKPQVSVLNSTAHRSMQQRPTTTTNYMTRLPPHVETCPKDFDENSLASLSLSNCSVASDILRKARERRDHFWSQPKHVTAS